jgi:hypothetical protein
VYPVAFFEFRKGNDGKVTREGPRLEKEELAAQDAWAVRFSVNDYIILLTCFSGSASASVSAFGRKQRTSRRFTSTGLDVLRSNPVGTGIQEAMVSKLSLSPWPCSMIRHADDMPEHIESMFDDCEYASDASSVLRRVSKSEAGWLARFARERVQQERETLELGLEQELQVMSASLMPLLTHAEVGAVRVSSARSAQLPRATDARCMHEAKTGASCSRTHSVGCSLTIVRRSARRTV